MTDKELDELLARLDKMVTEWPIIEDDPRKTAEDAAALIRRLLAEKREPVAHSKSQYKRLVTQGAITSQDGMVLVPREPTEEMMQRGTARFVKPHGTTARECTSAIYRAMLDARPNAEQTGQNAAGQDTARTFDATTWAKSFNETLVKLGHQPHDEGWLIGWFANAIMCGYDKALAAPSEDAKQYRLADEARAAGKNIPMECNQYTSTPCTWSNTPNTEDKCRVCGREFATWC